MEKKTGFVDSLKTLQGAPWYIFLGCVLIIYLAMALGVMPTDIAGCLGVSLAVGFVFYEIGERIPIWNTYIGGGLLATFFGVSILNTLGFFPEKYSEAVNEFWSGDASMLNFYIIMLIVGSIISLDRQLLLRSFAGYIPAILGGIVGAAVLGIAGGLVFGVGPMDIVVKYVLPIMGGGNGAGAVPLSQIYEQVTGDAAANYYAFAIIILTIANVMCILAGALLNRLGMSMPSLTGDKKTLMRRNKIEVEEEDQQGAGVKLGNKDFGAAFFLTFACYGFGAIIAKKVLPTILGAPIHQFAYMIIFVVILAAVGIIPESIRVAAKKAQGFCTGVLAAAIMVGMGVDFDIAELFTALTVSNVVIALLIVLGAIIGSAAIGYLVGFYPIDAAVTAGLCMANRGGSGDIAVLGAADRLDLIAYGQLSSRLGGGIVLIIASFVFSSAF